MYLTVYGMYLVCNQYVLVCTKYIPVCTKYIPVCTCKLTHCTGTWASLEIILFQQFSIAIPRSFCVPTSSTATASHWLPQQDSGLCGNSCLHALKQWWRIPQWSPYPISIQFTSTTFILMARRMPRWQVIEWRFWCSRCPSWFWISSLLRYFNTCMY